MSGGRVDCSDLVRFRDSLVKLKDGQEKFTEDMVKKLAARLLRNVKQKTPVKTGNLRRNWQVGKVIKKGNEYSVEIYNQTEYAEFVEYGHRKQGGKGWVQGRFMLTISEKELNSKKDAIIQSELEKRLKEMIGG